MLKNRLNVMSVVLFCVINICYGMLCCVVLFCVVVLCYVMLCCVVLCYVMFVSCRLFHLTKVCQSFLHLENIL